MPPEKSLRDVDFAGTGGFLFYFFYSYFTLDMETDVNAAQQCMCVLRLGLGTFESQKSCLNRMLPSAVLKPHRTLKNNSLCMNSHITSSH